MKIVEIQTCSSCMFVRRFTAVEGKVEVSCGLAEADFPIDKEDPSPPDQCPLRLGGVLLTAKPKESR